MIQTLLVLALAADTDVVEMAALRVYPLRMPENGLLPAIVYQRIANTPVNSINGDSRLDSIRIQVTCWGRRYSEAIGLATFVRNALTYSTALKAITINELDVEDPETRNYGVLLDFSIWTTFEPELNSVVARFIRVEYTGDTTTTELDLIYPIAENGFYVITLNGLILQEGESFALNSERNKITFTTPLISGAYRDEGLLIYQPESEEEVRATFERVEFEGDGTMTEIDLPSAIVQNGFYLVIKNGRLAQEGPGKEYIINVERNQVIFNSPLAGGDYKDEGLIIYQEAE